VIEFSVVPAIASFSGVALVVSTSYLLLSKVGGNFAALIRSRRNKEAFIPFEPGRFVQQEAQSIASHLRRHGTATLIFCASLVSLLAVGKQDWWPPMPAWAWWSISFGIVALLCYIQFRFVSFSIYRHKLNSLRNDHVVVANRLNEARARGYHVFHSIPMREGAIDHVVVGEKGIFAIQIVRPPSRKFTGVRIEGDMLVFSPHNVEKGFRKLSKFTNPVKFLSKRLSTELGHPINIVPIIVVPDCEVKSGSSEGCLLADPGSCIMFVGRNDPKAHLMNEEVKKISHWLIGRCRDRPFRKWRPRVGSGDIGYA
jgi:hypothetical protein